MNIPDININDYSYDLPAERIANKPIENRENSKLLVYDKGNITSSIFKNIAKHLPENAHLVINNSKVFPARIEFKNHSGASIEIFCLHPLDTAVNNENLQSMTWEVMVGNQKRWKLDEVLRTENALSVELLEKKIDSSIVKFSWIGEDTIYDLLEKIAQLPLPPYLNRKADKEDKVRYQTVYAQNIGSVAAPTAGLHITQNVLDSLQTNGHNVSTLTLHVGAGTFKPVKAAKIADHTMHSEYFNVDKQLIVNILNQQITIPVGTTSMRVLESIYWLGVEIILNNIGLENISIGQWVGYQENPNITPNEALQAIITTMESNKKDQIFGKTSIIILPGYQFMICKGIITNFHQPNSTLILLIAALLGENWRKVYSFALDNEYRFLSYGDSSLLIP